MKVFGIENSNLNFGDLDMLEHLSATMIDYDTDSNHDNDHDDTIPKAMTMRMKITVPLTMMC